MSLRNRVIAVACVVLLTLALAGCNTVRGVGRDIQRSGELLQDAANSTRK